MGAQQSSDRNSGSRGGEPAKKCYYEVLGIERGATEDEIKKAYRRKALELHPDRNYGNVESATIAFAEVSTAYEVLSDAQERAWYDSHRESILCGDTGAGEKEEHNVAVTSAGDLVGLMGRFNSRVPFTDAPDGFYGILQQTFANLAREEDAACDWEGVEPVDFPDFGGRDDGYEDVVRPFYRAWCDFSTKKTFGWREQYRASDAPDRFTRRAVEKENKRLREEGVREFNEAVRVLVAFVRKRDPRYVPNSQTEGDRQKILRDAAAAQAARSRKENKAKFKAEEHIVPEWAKARNLEEEGVEVGGFGEEEEEVVDVVECVVCGKVFKSERQYETHEKSKKHVKAVQQLQREMRWENEELGLDGAATDNDDLPVEEFAKLEVSDGEAGIPVQEDEETDDGEAEDGKLAMQHDGEIDSEKEGTNLNTPPSKAESHIDDSSSSSDIDDTYASRKTVLNRLTNPSPPSLDPASTPAASDIDNSSKVGKAKLKKLKKAAKAAEEDASETQFKCASCQESFESKTKLHKHVKQEGHAMSVGSGGAMVGKGKAKGKRGRNIMG